MQQDEFIILPTALLLKTATKLSGRDWDVLHALYYFAYKNKLEGDYFQVSQRELARRAGTDKRNVMRTIERLEKMGLVRRFANGKRSTYWRLEYNHIKK